MLFGFKAFYFKQENIHKGINWRSFMIFIFIIFFPGCSISKANRRIFKLEIGRSSESGSGVLLMKCNDEEISDTIRETMYAVMRALIGKTTF